MKNYKYITSIVLTMMILVSCQDFAELEQNKNLPTSVPPSVVIRSILIDLTNDGWSDEHRWNQFWASNYNYYETNEYWTTGDFNYLTLKNVIEMEKEALKRDAGKVNPYNALGKFFRAYFFVSMTQKFGDIPMGEALLGLKDEFPKFDSQKDVFKSSLQYLEEANTDLTSLINSGDNSLSGDFYYSNDLKKWQKAVNAFKLRVLINLSKKDTDAELSVKAKFAEVINNPTKYPLFSGMADNMEFVHNGITNKYPFNQDEFGKVATRYNMSATYLNTLVALKDPRTFVVAEPAKALVTAGKTGVDAYYGAPSGQNLDDMSVDALNGKISFPNKARYFSNYIGENTIQIGYSEQCFNIAEAINRGWVTGDAKTYYENGIKSSMSFYGITDATALSTYLAQGTVAYTNDAAGLTKILSQKYLAFFQNSGLEAYYNYRRTGVPAFNEGPGTGAANNFKIPRRFQYPVNERRTNAANYNTAITNQFSGADPLNMDLWIIK
jgi:Starch-binding associating with outer membrane